MQSTGKQFWATRDAALQKRFFWPALPRHVAAAGAVCAPHRHARLSRLCTRPLDPADVQKLTEQLDAQGIAHETSADGKTSISVPAAKLDAARMATASLGPPGRASANMGFELFDKMSWGQTEFDQKVTYQRALEGELERIDRNAERC
jgi:flagellar M-ring protein FliF